MCSVRGLGIDAVDVERFRRVMERRPRMADRLFTDAERADAALVRDPGPRLAARFAAKEAVMKALGVGLGAFAMSDVRVSRAESGAPHLELVGEAAALARRMGISRWHLSLTHTESVAIASVVAEGVEPDGSAT